MTGKIRGKQIKDESLTGDDVENESLTGTDVEDGSLGNSDLNITTPGQAVVTKVLNGDGLTLSNTGVDPGTGEATLSVDTTVARRTLPNTFQQENTFEANIFGDQNQAKNFAPPTDLSDLVNRAYVYDAIIENIIPRINDSTVDRIYLSGEFDLPLAGNYLVTVDFLHSHDAATNDLIADLDVDGTIHRILRKEPADAAGTGEIVFNAEDNINETTGTDQRESLSLGVYLPARAAGILPISLIWSPSGGGVESTIYNARIRVKRMTFEGTVTTP